MYRRTLQHAAHKYTQHHNCQVGPCTEGVREEMRKSKAKRIHPLPLGRRTCMRVFLSAYVCVVRLCVSLQGVPVPVDSLHSLGPYFSVLPRERYVLSVNGWAYGQIMHADKLGRNCAFGKCGRLGGLKHLRCFSLSLSLSLSLSVCAPSHTLPTPSFTCPEYDSVMQLCRLVGTTLSAFSPPVGAGITFSPGVVIGRFNASSLWTNVSGRRRWGIDRYRRGSSRQRVSFYVCVCVCARVLRTKVIGLQGLAIGTGRSTLTAPLVKTPFVADGCPGSTISMRQNTGKYTSPMAIAAIRQT
jgi:hypothetical protein